MPPKIPCPGGDAERWCPDCGHCKPVAEFSPKATYCKVHQAARTAIAKARAKQRNPEATRQARRAADKRYRETHREQINTYMRGWKRKNALKHARWNLAWQHNNPDKRRVIVERYRVRRKGLYQPASPIVPPTTPAPPPEVLRELEQQQRDIRRDD